jgi:hypothetical protein
MEWLAMVCTDNVQEEHAIVRIFDSQTHVDGLISDLPRRCARAQHEQHSCKHRERYTAIHTTS